MNMYKAVFLLSAALAAGSAAAFDDVQVTYRGVLRQNAATPTVANVSMEFRLYKDKGTETPLWTSGDMAVPLDALGHFQVALRGAGVASAIDGGARWVGVSIDGGKEQYPRQELLASPCAGLAERAEALSDSPSVKTAAVERVEATSLSVATLAVEGATSFPPSTSLLSMSVDLKRGWAVVPVEGTVKFFSRANPRDLGTRETNNGGCAFGTADCNCMALFMATGTDVMPAMSLFFRKGESVALPTSAKLPSGATVKCLVYPIGVE